MYIVIMLRAHIDGKLMAYFLSPLGEDFFRREGFVQINDKSAAPFFLFLPFGYYMEMYVPHGIGEGSVVDLIRVIERVDCLGYDRLLGGGGDSEYRLLIV